MAAAALFAVLLPTASQAENWPQWRGPTGQGVTEEKNLPTRWSDSEGVKWKVELPGPGNSTPAIWGDRLFLTQAASADKDRMLLCFDKKTGRELWRKIVRYEPAEQTWKGNPQCSASPAADEKHVVAWMGGAGVYCWDHEGNELWKRTDLPVREHEFGHGASPMIHSGLAILHHGPGEAGSALIAFDLKDGKTAWEIAIKEEKPANRTDGFKGAEAGKGRAGTWATPVIAQAKGRDELITGYDGKMRGLDPATGKELWACDGLNPLLYASPLVSKNGTAVIFGGYFGNALAVRIGGSGDVTAKRLWHEERAHSEIGSGVIVGDKIWMPLSNKIHVRELETGKIVHEQRLAGKVPATCWSSFLLAGDTIYYPNQAGDVIVFRVGETAELISINSLGEKINSSVVPSDGRLYIRTDARLWCIGQ